MNTSRDFNCLIMNKSRLLHVGLMLILLFSFSNGWAQDKISIQVKTFDQQLAPYRNIEISINGKEFIAMGTRGVAFIEMSEAELPVKMIKVKNEQLEAASWNYSKGILEIIIRTKSYQVTSVTIRDENRNVVPNLKITFTGRKIASAVSDNTGRIELPLALDEKLLSANQFAVDGYISANLLLSSAENTLMVRRVGARQNSVDAENKKPEERNFFQDFNLSNLDSIQSLTVFYAVFKNYDRRKLSEEEQKKVDAKFNELMKQLEQSVSEPVVTSNSFIGKITDSTFVAQDIKNLVGQVEEERQGLTDNRTQFDQKIELINEKLSKGLVNLDGKARQELLSDLALLERLLIENESQFYKNQNDYRALINAVKEKFFDLEQLEEKLNESEQQRLEEQRLFRQRLIAITSLVLVFGLLIVLLIYFSRSLRKEKRKLEAANSEIKRINENLERLVLKRTHLLATANKELDTFLYRASHDLRTPIRSIMGLCNIANMLVQGEAKEFIKRIGDSIAGMDKLLKKLSIVSEINQPSNFSSISLVQVIDTIQHSFKKEIQESKVEFTVTCSADQQINSYPNLIETILLYSIENAIYYSSSKGNQMPEVSVLVNTSKDITVISIHDNGPGIDDTIRGHVFDMFFRGSELSKGHGLGLYIVKKAVLALRGTIEVESEPDRFTKLTITLPSLSLKKNTPSVKVA